MRQIILDTETTGLKTSDGHRIIEIGAVELVNRRFSQNNFQQYINPEREIDAGALAVHGISLNELKQKPLFNEIAAEFIRYIEGAELIIHNAAFDLEFLNYELAVAGLDFKIEDKCEITDSLQLARDKYPGQRNSLDALCRRLGVDNSARELHGALLDAEILADVYLLMTGGQFSMSLELDTQTKTAGKDRKQKVKRNLIVLSASSEELAAHEAFVKELLG